MPWLALASVCLHWACWGGLVWQMHEVAALGHSVCVFYDPAGPRKFALQPKWGAAGASRRSLPSRNSQARAKRPKRKRTSADHPGRNCNRAALGGHGADRCALRRCVAPCPGRAPCRLLQRRGGERARRGRASLRLRCSIAVAIGPVQPWPRPAAQDEAERGRIRAGGEERATSQGRPRAEPGQAPRRPAEKRLGARGACQPQSRAIGPPLVSWPAAASLRCHSAPSLEPALWLPPPLRCSQPRQPQEARAPMLWPAPQSPLPRTF